MRYYCTYFDRNYLTRALALITSLQKHETEPFKMYAVCMDEISRTLLAKMNIDNVVLIPFHEIEQNDFALLSTKKDRSAAEYYWTSTPTIIMRILERNPEIDLLTYLDADMLFFSSPQPIFDEMSNASVLIHEHRFSPELVFLEEENGTYNVGLLSFRNNEEGFTVLRWWRDRCIEWCYARYEDGKMGDQLYLNGWPEKFNGVHVLKHIGAGTAPWNQQQYRFRKNGGVKVNGLPLVFYHFQSFAFFNEKIAIPAKHTTYPYVKEVLDYCVVPYISALNEELIKVRSILPEFDFGFEREFNLTGAHIFIIDKEDVPKVKGNELPQTPIELEGGKVCFASEQVRLQGSVPNESQEVKNDRDVHGGRGKIKVSAIVSVYKAGRFIKGCLDDLMNQTLYKKGELEIVIINSGSPENEHEIITDYKHRYDNIVYIRTDKREPIYTAWNRGVHAASGEYITNANTDDRHKQDALEILANELDNNPCVQLVYADIYLTEKENDLFENAAGYREANRPDFNPEIMLTGCHMGPQPMWRKSAHDTAGYFNEAYKSAGDYEFWCRMVLVHGMKLKHVPQTLGLYLFNRSGIELGNLPLSQMEAENILDTYKKYILKKSNNAAAENEPIDIVFLTWNRLKYFKQTIEQLILNTRYNYRIIIVDNKSDESFREYLRHSEILYDELILNANNEWTAAFQKGIDVTQSDPFIVSDPDILVPALEGKCWLERMIDLHAANEDMGLIALNLDDSNLPPKLPDVYLGDKEVYNKDIVLSNVGTVMQAVKRKYFNFPYITDWETCERIRRNGGKVGFAKNLVGYHLGWNEEKDYPEYLVDKYKFFKTVYNVDTYKMNTTNNELISKMDASIRGNGHKEVATSIVIPIYNQADYTKITLNSILETTPGSFEIILIDNNSTETVDDYVEVLRNAGVDIKIIKNKTNLGFPAAVNQGLTEAKGKYIVVANNDIILNTGWLNRLVQTADSDNAIGIVSGISNNVSGVQKDENATYTSIEEMKEYAKETADKYAGQAMEFPRVAFICTLIKREVLNKIGGFDERFSPGNYEDDDYCIRNQIAGYKSVICKDVFIHHFGSKSFKADGDSKYNALLEKNRNKFVAKWGNDPDAIWLNNGKFTRREADYPIDGNEIHRFIKRANNHIASGEYELGLENLEKCIGAFKRKNITEEGTLHISKVEELAAKIRNSVGTIG